MARRVIVRTPRWSWLIGWPLGMIPLPHHWRWVERTVALDDILGVSLPVGTRVIFR